MVRLSLRFILPLAFVIAVIALCVNPLVDTLISHWFVKDLEMRASVTASSLMEDSLAPLLKTRSRSKIEAVFNDLSRDEWLDSIAYCDLGGRMLYRSKTFPGAVTCKMSKTAIDGAGMGSVIKLRGHDFHVIFEPISVNGKRQGDLVLVQDMNFVLKRDSRTRRFLFILFSLIAAVVAFVTVIVAQLSWKGWVNGLRSLLKGEGLFSPASRPFGKSVSPELRPVVKDLRVLVRELESERRARDESQVSWTPRALREILQEQLAGEEILIVSNREPYIHVRKNEKIEIQIPASGLVTALEPVMRACSGTWIAHGSGTADREVVDQRDHVRVPPSDPSYQIRRVWLTEEEEKGHYYGFANEGLWPLCHIAHTRPVFRSSDWTQYVAVNQKFADAVVEEASTEDPVVLVQDYHFALLPRMVRKKLPKATIITFWHIPWPNPEAFGICPWREELIDGLLGSNILGFHTRFHCGNFIDTVDRFIESRIERETSTISYGGAFTAVNHYPISIEYPPRDLSAQQPVGECRKRIREEHGFPEDRFLGIGVDRLDYTKGILERFLAVERLLELEPHWIGHFTFVQIAAPSRSSIAQYRDFGAQVIEVAERINSRFGSPGYEPICLKVEHHEPGEIFRYFRAADLCFVSSLHDGMNLVAKEFVASRDDEQGVLILSQFTGASHELPEALIVNPYNIDQCAAALHMALGMSKSEQKSRMRSMRGLIQEFNVYRWAGRMLIDAAKIRQRNRFLRKTRASANNLVAGTVL